MIDDHKAKALSRIAKRGRYRLQQLFLRKAACSLDVRARHCRNVARASVPHECLIAEEMAEHLDVVVIRCRRHALICFNIAVLNGIDVLGQFVALRPREQQIDLIQMMLNHADTTLLRTRTPSASYRSARTPPTVRTQTHTDASLGRITELYLSTHPSDLRACAVNPGWLRPPTSPPRRTLAVNPKSHPGCSRGW
jgi:hypothetical protein